MGMHAYNAYTYTCGGEIQKVLNRAYIQHHTTKVELQLLNHLSFLYFCIREDVRAAIMPSPLLYLLAQNARLTSDLFYPIKSKYGIHDNGRSTDTKLKLCQYL